MPDIPTPAVLKDLSIVDILAQYPQVRPVLSQYGLEGYAATETARHENLAASALVQGIDSDEVADALMEAIRR